MRLKDSKQPVSKTSKWFKYLIIALIIEKIVQHIFVTIAFYFNWSDVASTVAVSPRVLMILGAIVAALFILSLWGMLSQKRWAVYLVAALAVFDLVGEFVAQGTIEINITISFIVAAILLVLSFFYLRNPQID